MKSSIFIAGLSALMVTAAPVEKRVIYTQIVKHVVHVTKTEFVNGPAPTDNVVVAAAPEPEPEVKVKVKTVVYKVQPQQPEPVYVKPEAENKVVYTTVVKQPEQQPEQPAPTPTQEQPKQEPAQETKQETQPETKVESNSNQLEPLTGDYVKIMLSYHNAHRANHSAPALEWDADLAKYAEITSSSCKMEHQMDLGGINYGQNLAYVGASDDDGSENRKKQCGAGAITNQWYNGEVMNWSYYDQPNIPSGLSHEEQNKILHFSQLVWKGSNKVGCATVRCNAGTLSQYPSWLTTCNYVGRGNVGGAYGTNVLRSTGAPRLTV